MYTPTVSGTERKRKQKCKSDMSKQIPTKWTMEWERHQLNEKKEENKIFLLQNKHFFVYIFSLSLCLLISWNSFSFCPVSFRVIIAADVKERHTKWWIKRYIEHFFYVCLAQHTSEQTFWWGCYIDYCMRTFHEVMNNFL